MAILKVYLYIIILFIVKDVGEKVRKKAKKWDIVRYFKIKENKSRKMVKIAFFRLYKNIKV